MSGSFLLGLDIGGGGGRCLVVELESRRTASIHRPWSFAPDPDLPTAVNVDTGEVWHALGECVRECLRLAEIGPESIAGIAATSMRHASAILDADGAEVLVTTNQDARGLVDSVGLAQEYGEEAHRRTGHWPNPVQAAGRLRWLARERPDAWKRAAVHFALSDWLAHRLCGVAATEPSHASETLLFELGQRAWAADWIERLEFPLALFPDVRNAGERLGELLPEAARDLGLRPGIPVAVGGGDTQCGLLGAGAVAPDSVALIAGTTAPIQWVRDSVPFEASGRMWAAHHVLPDRWVLESNAGGLGSAAEWAAGLLFPDAPEPLLELLAAAVAAPPGARGATSTLGAEVMNARQFGLPVGNLTTSFMSGGTPHERRANTARAVVEGLTFALRANLEQLEAVFEARVPVLRMAGGLSRSRSFTQLLSDVLGRPVEVTATPEASALGAAICAGVGAGCFADLAAGAKALTRVERTCEPDSVRSGSYSELYPAWNELRLARSESDAMAAGLVIRGLMSGATPAPHVATSGDPVKILVTAEMEEPALARLRGLGSVEHRGFKRAMRLLKGRALADALESVAVFVTEIDIVDAATLGRAADLQVVATCRGDAVNVDVEACTALGIPVLHAPGRNADSVADLTLAFLLMLARRMPEATGFLRAPDGVAGDMARMGRAFAGLQGRELGRRTVGLIGLGAVGRAVAARLRSFHVRCVACDPHLDDDAVRRAGAEPVTLPVLLAASDFVSLHASAAPDAPPLLGTSEFAQMRAGSFLVNTARAALVDRDALIEALASNHLAGAALDVFAVEPPGSDDPLLAFPNVIATPHIGGNTADVAHHQGAIIAAALECLRAGAAPACLLNPETLPAFHWGVPRPPPSPALVTRLDDRPAPGVSDLQKDQSRQP